MTVMMASRQKPESVRTMMRVVGHLTRIHSDHALKFLPDPESRILRRGAQAHQNRVPVDAHQHRQVTGPR